MKGRFGLVIACLVLVIVSISAIPADILDERIQDSKSFDLPPIGEVNAGIGSTISVPEMSKEEKKENLFEEYSENDFKKLSVKKLKEFLKERGLECKGCSEKADFVKLAYDNRSVPPTAAENTSNPDSEKKSGGVSDVPDGEKIDKEKLDELLAKLKQNGFGNSQFFNADDLRNMNPEEMAAKFGDKSGSSSSKSKKKSSSSSSSGSKKKKENTKAKKESKPKAKTSSSRPTVPTEPVEEEQAIEL